MYILIKCKGWVYTHATVIHDANFVNPDNPDIHTQNIENMWMRVKRKIRPTIWNIQGTVSDIPFRISMEELPPE
jgi:hypothetical protein